MFGGENWQARSISIGGNRHRRCFHAATRFFGRLAVDSANLMRFDKMIKRRNGKGRTAHKDNALLCAFLRRRIGHFGVCHFGVCHFSV